MKSNQLKINYEPEADVLTYEITSQPIDYAKEIGNIVVHFTKSNMPVLVEILEATKFLKKAEKLTSKADNLSLNCAR
ncbi:MAG: DUF2283 domain-containing protein [Patescibacteria group bacterium]|jgi:hypothetical protein